MVLSSIHSLVHLCLTHEKVSLCLYHTPKLFYITDNTHMHILKIKTCEKSKKHVSPNKYIPTHTTCGGKYQSQPSMKREGGMECGGML